MDTSYLTKMAYEILILAHGQHTWLDSEIGADAMNFKDEEEFLVGTLENIEEILDDPEDYLDWCNLLEEVCINKFTEKLNKIKAHIIKTQKTPIEERGKPDYE
jgi:ethanolamine utilization cobalamin adenosyltransferase